MSFRRGLIGQPPAGMNFIVNKFNTHSMNLIIIEDEGWENLRPLSLTRPVWDMRCGILTLREKIERRFGAEISGFICRDYLAPFVADKNPGKTVNVIPEGETLFINGRAIFNSTESFADLKEDYCFFTGDELAAIYIKDTSKYFAEGWNFEQFDLNMSGLLRKKADAVILNYLWDFIAENHHQIASDLHLVKGFYREDPSDFVKNGIYIVEGEGFFTGKNVSISPGVVIDTSNGAVILDDDVKVMPNAVIIGPVYIGKGSLVKIGAKIYDGVSIGPVCKVGGEIEETIIQGYSNKQHEGFLGHAFLGEWCNLGAGTENSDLKNNYTNVKVQIGDKRVNTGKTFIGLFMGDHSKTGINTTFNTGTAVEVAAMAFGAGFQPRFIPSYHWSDGGKMTRADFDATIKTASIVMGRRDVELSEEEIDVLRYIFENSVK